MYDNLSEQPGYVIGPTVSKNKLSMLIFLLVSNVYSFEITIHYDSYNLKDILYALLLGYEYKTEQPYNTLFSAFLW